MALGDRLILIDLLLLNDQTNFKEGVQIAYRDLREFIRKVEQEGELKRIKAEVDWNLEFCTTAKLNESKKRGHP